MQRLPFAPLRQTSKRGPGPNPREFREDVIRIAHREPGVRIKGVAADFRISEGRLTNWLVFRDRDIPCPGRHAGDDV